MPTVSIIIVIATFFLARTLEITRRCTLWAPNLHISFRFVFFSLFSRGESDELEFHSWGARGSHLSVAGSGHEGRKENAYVRDRTAMKNI